MQVPGTPHSYEKRVEKLERDKRLLQQQLEEAQFKNKRLQERLERLEKELDESHRAAHRQAAPIPSRPSCGNYFW
jgi:predicted RNase H-like nuclease (RuvC/YqgF family)